MDELFTDLASIGVYCFSQAVLDLVPPSGTYDIASQLIPKVLARGLPVAAFPTDQDNHEHLEDSINQIILNDRSVTLQKESSDALGAGWRLGFLGTLHCSVFEDRLRQEHGANIIITPPSVPFKVIWRDGTETMGVRRRRPGDEHRTVSLFFDPDLLVLLRVRAALAAAPDDLYAEVVEAVAGYREAGPHTRCATSVLVPSRADWVERKWATT